MNMFITFAPIAAGAYLILGALTLHTKNMRSAFVFKVLPFAFGSCSIFAGLKLWGVV